MVIEIIAIQACTQRKLKTLVDDGLTDLAEGSIFEDA